MNIRLSSGNRASVAMKLGETALVARYAQEAKEASESAKAASSHPPIIGGNGNWQIWNQGSGAYVDSGLCALGPAGEQGPQGEAGNYTKPAAGIPEEDLSQAVRDKLNSGGASDYADLNNKPGINGVTLSGNKTAAQLGLAASNDVPTKTSQLQNDAGFLTRHQSLAAYRTAAAQDVIDAGKETAGLGLTGASVGDLVRVKTVDTNGKPTSWQKAPLCDITTNPNLLDNWYFVGGGSQSGDGVFPINQQGQTVYPSIDTIDRWNVSAANRVNVELLTDAMRLTKSGSIALRFRQYVNSYDGQMTLSVLVKSATYSAGSVNLVAYSETGVIELTAIPSSNAKQLISMTFNAADLNHVAVSMTSSVTADSYIDVIAIKLELGSYQTLAHNEGTDENPVWILNEIPDYGEELAKCQRYFQTFRTEALRPTYGADCRPLMAADEPTKGTITIDGVTYYTLTA